MTGAEHTKFDAAAYLRYLRGGDTEARAAFLRTFGIRLPPIARHLAWVFRELSWLDRFSQHDERLAQVHMFLHAGLNSVYSSTLLLVDGFPLAAGNLMRHYGDACAMALLLFDDNPSVWHLYSADSTKYPVHKAVHRLLQSETSQRLRRLVGFDVDGWRRLLDLAKFYDDFSHASAFSLGFHLVFDQPGMVVMGPYFDPGKRRPISIELKRRRSALPPLAGLVRSIRAVVKTRMRRGSLTWA